MLIATTTGWNCDDFWATDIPNPRNSCPFNFLDYMSKRRFNAILCELCLTDREQPPFVDKFWKVCQMVAEWNANMALQFVVGWIVCLDKSMSIFGQSIGNILDGGFVLVSHIHLTISTIQAAEASWGIYLQWRWLKGKIIQRILDL